MSRGTVVGHGYLPGFGGGVGVAAVGADPEIGGSHVIAGRGVTGRSPGSPERSGDGASTTIRNAASAAAVTSATVRGQPPPGAR